MIYEMHSYDEKIEWFDVKIPIFLQNFGNGNDFFFQWEEN